MSDSRYPTPEAAEAAFYQAFEAADLGAMLALWADDDSIACVHPGAPLLRGRNAVAESWRGILTEPARMAIHAETLSQHVGEGVAVHILHEHITLQGEETPRDPVMVTNVYRETPAGWRMVLHHASPVLRRNPAPEEQATVH
jgi:uncharacterized protein (TIGR02246 family)